MNEITSGETPRSETGGKKASFVANPSGIIQMNSTPISLIQRKCWLLLLYNAFPHLKVQKRYTISISQLRTILKYNDTKQLKDALEGLVTSRIEFNVLRTKDHNIWQVMTLLSVAMIKDNVLTYGYVEELLEKLIKKPIYTKIKIEIVKRITSKHSLAMYELACDHLLPNGTGTTPYISLSELYKLLGCNGNEAYNNFKYFNRDILKKAVAEVNAKTDILIDVKVKRSGRKSYAVQFYISEKRIKPSQLHTSATIHEIQDTQVKVSAVEAPVKDDNTLYQQLIAEYDQTPKQAKKILDNYDSGYIIERMDYITQIYKKTNKAKSVGALTDWAMKFPNLTKTIDHDVVKPFSTLPKIVPGMQVNIGNGRVLTADDDGFFFIDNHHVVSTQDIRLGILDGRFTVES
jgi:plasmid replication initiation protein